VRITEQTPDSKTLRFAVMGNQRPVTRPGQFVTFSFLYDGKKVIRSYSICSAPIAAGYIEITPKRVPKGCASVFLNDRATPGLTVEAQGPFGRFCLDPNTRRNVVMLAGGSGITPFIAMLRYADDLCLNIDVTLIYCVRTPRDIIFERELERLRSNLERFRFAVLPGEAGANWTGPQGRITREFLEAAVNDPGSADFFLCGPPPFMDTSRAILTAMGVKEGRILQESFGGRPPADTGADALIEFARSGKTCVARAGQSVLEAAEESGVAIPYSCRAGQCGTCKTRLLEGRVRMDAETGLDPDSRARGFVLTCVGRADGAIKLDA